MAFGHFSFGLSQFHGHHSWLVCEVALRIGISHIFHASTVTDERGEPTASYG
jgi:hypothetical protein